MRYKFFLIFLFFTVYILEFSYGQKDNIKKDSIKIYRNIETFSKKRKSTEYIYHLLFLPVATTPIPKSKTSKKQHANLKSNRNFEGKIIRNINITTLNPFGYSIGDTAVEPQNLIYRAGNNLHIRSRQITIRNLLLIHKNKPFDSLLVKESERLIRAQQYVHEVSLIVDREERRVGKE